MYLWISPGGETRNQIDNIMVRLRWRSSITNAHTLHEADCGSDHQLLINKLRLKPTAARVIERPTRLEVRDTREFRSSIDADLTRESPDALWDPAKILIATAVSETAQPTTTRKRQHWMNHEYLNMRCTMEEVVLPVQLGVRVLSF